MKIFLNSNLSLLEYLYLETMRMKEEVDPFLDFSGNLINEIKLFNELNKSDYVVGCTKNDLFYDKTIIINNENYDKDTLSNLSQYNKIISRFILPSGLVDDYEVDPYENTKLLNFRFNGKSNEVMSKLSINSYIINKDEIGYYMKCPKMFMPTKVGGKLNVIGLLSLQKD